MLSGPLTFGPLPREGEMVSTGEIGLSNDAEDDEKEVVMSTTSASNVKKLFLRTEFTNFRNKLECLSLASLSNKV
jgi:hypothetical protein